MSKDRIGLVKETKTSYIICDNYQEGKCKLGIVPTSDCGNCPVGKPANTCVLLCHCEEEACNIGRWSNE